MKQILHIFRKDTRHFWLEILTSLLITALCTAHIPVLWGTIRLTSLLNIVHTLQILVPLSWWLLIARAVHDEPLVGNEQFWITRPYEWKKLLAAKLLFIAAWIALPYLLTQSYLLSEAGFNPLSYLPGLLANLLVASALILPLVAVATVTPNFARMTLTLLGALVVAIGASLFSNTVHGYQTLNPYHNHFFFPLILSICALAIALQYATRTVWRARILLVAVPVLAGISCLAYRSQSLVDSAYPQPNTTSTPAMMATLVVDPHWTSHARSWQGEYYFGIRLQYSGIADGYALSPDNFKFTLTAADGYQWTSPWQSLNDTDTFLPGTHGAGLDLKLSQGLYERFKSAPVTVQITLALSRLQSDTVLQIPAPLHNTLVPGIGFCSPVYRSSSIGWDALNCRSALRVPRRTYVSTLSTTAPCSDTPAPPEGTIPGTTWTGTVDSGDLLSRMGSAINPVPPSFVYFKLGAHPDNGMSWHFCPGTPITLTQYHLADRTQATFTIPNFQLPTHVIQTGY